jgi:hypothetical protein
MSKKVYTALTEENSPIKPVAQAGKLLHSRQVGSMVIEQSAV